MTPKDLFQKKLVICVGAGGVGKTSMAAAMGVEAALQGKKVLVLTIDPAKRLANSLGLEEFGNEAKEIDLSSLKESEGELWAMMLDGKHAFHELINRVTKDEKTKKDIYNNNIYQSIAESIVGNQEYMATEKLYDVVESGKYDFIILDTPPVKNALDFLESPGKMAQFVDKRVMKWFIQSSGDRKRLLGRLLSGTSGALFRLLGHVFGKEFLEDIVIFFNNFKGLYEGFHERHQAVEQLFRDKDTSFVIVCAPTEPAVEVSNFFVKELRRREMPLVGVIANQCHLLKKQSDSFPQSLKEEIEKTGESISSGVGAIFYARLSMAYRRLEMLHNFEQRLVQDIEEGLGKEQFLQRIPRLAGEVHDIQALHVVGQFLLEKEE